LHPVVERTVEVRQRNVDQHPGDGALLGRTTLVHSDHGNRWGDHERPTPGYAATGCSQSIRWSYSQFCLAAALAANFITSGSTIRPIRPTALPPPLRWPIATIRSTRLRRRPSEAANARATSGTSRRHFASVTASSSAIEAPCPDAGDVACA